MDMNKKTIAYVAGGLLALWGLVATIDHFEVGKSWLRDPVSPPVSYVVDDEVKTVAVWFDDVEVTPETTVPAGSIVRVRLGVTFADHVVADLPDETGPFASPYYVHLMFSRQVGSVGDDFEYVPASKRLVPSQEVAELTGQDPMPRDQNFDGQTHWVSVGEVRLPDEGGDWMVNVSYTPKERGPDGGAKIRRASAMPITLSAMSVPETVVASVN